MNIENAMNSINIKDVFDMKAIQSDFEGIENMKSYASMLLDQTFNKSKNGLIFDFIKSYQ